MSEEDARYLGWRDFDAAMWSLGQEIAEEFEPDVIVGIARGGLPGAVQLSHGLDADLAMVSATHYDDQQAQGDVEVGPLYGIHGGADVLIFDEIVGTGKTMQEVRQEVESQSTGIIRSASIHVNEESGIDPDYWIERVDEWVVYPWEVDI